MTGDRLETDILLGLNAGMATALVLTGATSMEDIQESEIRPSYILHSLTDLP
jgi:arabinose operon protein AraL